VSAEGRRGVLIGYQKFFFLPSGVKLSTIIIEPNLRRGFKMRFNAFNLRFSRLFKSVEFFKICNEEVNSLPLTEMSK